MYFFYLIVLKVLILNKTNLQYSLLHNYRMNLKKIKSSIKIIILCGGFGTRLAEETRLVPKPMVKIGRKPILLHIINLYAKYNYKNFILACGYKANVIFNFFSNKNTKYRNMYNKELNIFPVDTGLKTMTGGRLLKLKKYFGKKEIFMTTYGDGLCNVNIDRLLKFHIKHKKIATMTIVRPPARFGVVTFNSKKIIEKFEEKPQVSEGWINGGFFVFDSRIFNYIKNSDSMLEKYTFEKLSKLKQLVAFEHVGYWQCMDTLRDKIYLNKMCKIGKTPWTR